MVFGLIFEAICLCLKLLSVYAVWLLFLQPIMLRFQMRHIPGPRLMMCGKLWPAFRSAMKLSGGIAPTTVASHNFSINCALHRDHGTLVRKPGIGISPLLSLADPTEAMRFLNSPYQSIHGRRILKPFVGEVSTVPPLFRPPSPPPPPPPRAHAALRVKDLPPLAPLPYAQRTFIYPSSPLSYPFSIASFPSFPPGPHPRHRPQTRQQAQDAGASLRFGQRQHSRHASTFQPPHKRPTGGVGQADRRGPQSCWTATASATSPTSSACSCRTSCPSAASVRPSLCCRHSVCTKNEAAPPLFV